MRQFIFGIALLVSITGCTKEFNLDPSQAKEMYVIDGRISNMKGPYYVRVTRTMSGYLPVDRPGGVNKDTADPVTNALLIITDDSGVRDTLIPATNVFEGMMYYYRNGVIDSVYEKRYDVNTRSEKGFYQTTKLKGVPGRTYRLRVEVDGQVLHATTWMPPVATLEHTAYRDTTIGPLNEVGPIPMAYFKDPPGEKNYYLLKNYALAKYPYDNYFEKSVSYGGGLPYIDYYFFDDKLLSPELNAIPSQKTFNWSAMQFNPFFYDAEFPIQVRLCSLTKEAYDYIKSFSKQVTNDGNIYKPAPASPKGNISGALGLFTASEISYRLLFP